MSAILKIICKRNEQITKKEDFREIFKKKLTGVRLETGKIQKYCAGRKTMLIAYLGRVLKIISEKKERKRNLKIYPANQKN